MEAIDRTSRLTVEFTLSWSSGTMTHLERYYADPVSSWRDVLDDGLVSGLLGRGAGACAEVAIGAGRFPAPRDERRVVRVRPAQFQGLDGAGNPLVPRVGRYYPEGLLHGVGGVYQQSTSPCRFLGREGDHLMFDLNHPLAGRDLRLQAEVLQVHPPQKERGGRCEDWLDRVTPVTARACRPRPRTGWWTFSIRRVSGATTTARTICSTSSRGWCSTWTVPAGRRSNASTAG